MSLPIDHFYQFISCKCESLSPTIIYGYASIQNRPIPTTPSSPRVLHPGRVPGHRWGHKPSISPLSHLNAKSHNLTNQRLSSPPTVQSPTPKNRSHPLTHFDRRICTKQGEGGYKRRSLPVPSSHPTRSQARDPPSTFPNPAPAPRRSALRPLRRPSPQSEYSPPPIRSPDLAKRHRPSPEHRPRHPPNPRRLPLARHRGRPRPLRRPGLPHLYHPPTSHQHHQPPD
jgi:hypothetical protein